MQAQQRPSDPEPPMAQASGAPLPAVESGEFSAQEPSGNGSKRDEPYKYYDGGHEEVQR